ncbi:hypothetical protein P775_23270 [Puniceibacterium antarcticum]|uniref:Methyl-accepting chemotaxis protein n=2 Tax=Puniceibacterium antarcticum TaxID=1206336 RepID=A0A2G8R9F3_9RHOB|nr:hypothetical protein P775_23270 [Puniceibacterium antarcticum]
MAFASTAGTLAIAAIGFIGMLGSDHGLSVSTTATSAVLNQKQADMMHDSLRADVLFAILTGPEGAAEDREAAQAELARHVADFESSIAALQKLPLDPEIRTNVDAVVPLLAAYISKAEEASGAALADTAAGRALMPNFNAAFTDLEGAMEVLGERIEDFGNSAGIQAQAQNWVWLQIMAVMSILVAGGTFVSNHILSNSISRPLAVVTLDIEAVSRGDLDQPAQDIDRNDEVGSIAKAVSLLREKLVEAREAERERLEGTQQRVVSALGVGLRNLADGDLTRTIPNDFPQEYAGLRDDYNRAVETLRDTIARIVDASRTIRKETGEIRSASANLSQRTENQAATLEETAAALEELTANVASAARGAREVEGIVNETRLDAAKSGEIVRNAVEAINGIKQSSEEISTIIGLIEDIAFQTNLLALNAGVEAARAGEAGRGFAIVASEVRTLAQRTFEASSNIKSLIGKSAALVTRGVAEVGLTGKSIEKIVESVNNISTLVTSIASGASEQSVGLGEINLGVGELDTVTQQNAAMVNDSLSATGKLQENVDTLFELVAKFTTSADQEVGQQTAEQRSFGRAA